MRIPVGVRYGASERFGPQRHGGPARPGVRASLLPSRPSGAGLKSGLPGPSVRRARPVLPLRGHRWFPAPVRSGGRPAHRVQRPTARGHRAASAHWLGASAARLSDAANGGCSRPGDRMLVRSRPCRGLARSPRDGLPHRRRRLLAFGARFGRHPAGRTALRVPPPRPRAPQRGRGRSRHRCRTASGAGRGHPPPRRSTGDPCQRSRGAAGHGPGDDPEAPTAPRAPLDLGAEPRK